MNIQNGVNSLAAEFLPLSQSFRPTQRVGRVDGEHILKILCHYQENHFLAPLHSIKSEHSCLMKNVCVSVCACSVK